VHDVHLHDVTNYDDAYDEFSFRSF
jgi:hypothetical protein